MESEITHREGDTLYNGPYKETTGQKHLLFSGLWKGRENSLFSL